MFCTKCGMETNSASSFCQSCEEKVRLETAASMGDNYHHDSIFPPTNSSGLGESSIVPSEIMGWSWGAFLWGWIWAIGNKTWVGLLDIIPSVGLIMRIILGVKGRAWAWRNKKWDSIEHFKSVQKKWAVWGLILSIFPTIIFISIMSTAVLSTINPTQQVSKAKDATSSNNAIELLNAFERYYANNNSYPWGDSNSQLVTINNAGWMDLLYSSSELKESFGEKLSTSGDVYTLYHNDPKIYVCFIPKSEYKKETAKLRCSSDVEISNTNLCRENMEQICVPDNY